MCYALVPQHRDRAAGHARRDGPGHAGGVRAGAPPVRAAASATNLLIFLPMAAPEIVMGSSLLALFVAAGLRRPARLLDDPHRPHHVLPVLRRGHRAGAARRHGRRPGAGRDGPVRQRGADVLAGDASRWSSPASSAAALLCFSLSFDDFIVTNLNAGQTTTFPMYVWGVGAAGVPMQMNVIGTVMFLVSMVIVVGGELGNRRRTRAPA